MRWHQDAIDFAESNGIERDIVEAAAVNPSIIQPDPRSAEVGYPIERRRRGDVEAIVGLRDPDDPLILYVRVHTPLDGYTGGHATAAGSGKGSATPTSMRELRRRIVAKGYSIVAGGRHDKVLREDGSTAMTLPKTPSDNRSLANAWAEFTRRLKVDQKKKP